MPDWAPPKLTPLVWEGRQAKCTFLTCSQVLLLLLVGDHILRHTPPDK